MKRTVTTMAIVAALASAPALAQAGQSAKAQPPQGRGASAKAEPSAKSASPESAFAKGRI